jgi:hypothetical protein
MEVHHHAHLASGETHTARKKWTHYFWEFLMLFLAVFCGFLAEYQLEHTIEHNREKEFMRSLAEDLETDTLELNRAVVKADTVAVYSDSVLIFLAAYKISKQVPFRFATLVRKAGQNQFLINTDRTSSQLKNSGAMRLIRKKRVSDFILNYWKQIDVTNISLNRYMVYRNAGRELVFKLWVIPEVYHRDHSVDQDSQVELQVIDEDPKKWHEFANLIAMGGAISREAHVENLKVQLKMAKELILIIKQEYHFYN